MKNKSFLDFGTPSPGASSNYEGSCWRRDRDERLSGAQTYFNSWGLRIAPCPDVARPYQTLDRMAFSLLAQDVIIGCRTVIMVIYLSHNSWARSTANLAPVVPMLCRPLGAGETKGTVKLKSFHLTQATGRSTSNRPTRSKHTSGESTPTWQWRSDVCCVYQGLVSSPIPPLDPVLRNVYCLAKGINNGSYQVLFFTWRFLHTKWRILWFLTINLFFPHHLSQVGKPQPLVVFWRAYPPRFMASRKKRVWHHIAAEWWGLSL